MITLKSAREIEAMDRLVEFPLARGIYRLT